MSIGKKKKKAERKFVLEVLDFEPVRSNLSQFSLGWKDLPGPLKKEMMANLWEKWKWNTSSVSSVHNFAKDQNRSEERLLCLSECISYENQSMKSQNFWKDTSSLNQNSSFRMSHLRELYSCLPKYLIGETQLYQVHAVIETLTLRWVCLLQTGRQ